MATLNDKDFIMPKVSTLELEIEDITLTSGGDENETPFIPIIPKV